MSVPNQIDSLILEQLAGGEKGVLRLVVALRRRLGGFEKGNLPAIAKSALHKLVVSQAVLDNDGIYSLRTK
jgi:hypothetical protein